MKKLRFLIPSLVLAVIIAALSTGPSQAWYVSKGNLGTLAAATGKIDADIAFSLNENKGIPGEYVAVSEENKLKKTAGSEDFFFKLTYTVSYDDPIPNPKYIKDLKFEGEPSSGVFNGMLISAGGFNNTDNTKTYYGIHSGISNEDLGPLLAGFNVLRNPEMEGDFTITAKVDACQLTKEAVADIFGLTEEYLNNTFGGVAWR